MRKKFLLFVLLLVPLALPASAHAQQQVVLGNATAELTGPWKFHTGDNPAWANPDFDDSGWSTMDLTPLPGSVDPNSGSHGFVPGWTARGYAGYSGYAWYRLRANILQENVLGEAKAAKEALAIRMPDEFDDAYQIYVNGQLAGQFGKFSNHGVTYYDNRPLAFSLPANLPSGPVTIAIRMWMAAATPVLQQEAGGLHGPPVLGRTRIIQDLLRLRGYTVYLRGASSLLEMAVQPLAILIAFWFFALDRSELAYLWLGLNCTISLAFLVLAELSIHTIWIPGNSLVFVLFAILPAVQIGVWVLFWSYWFRLERTVQMAWLYRFTWVMVLLLAAGSAMQQTPLYGRVVPVHAIVWLSPLTVMLTLLLGLVLVWVTYQGIRRNRTEGLLALTAVLLVAISRNVPQLAALHIPTVFSFFGVRIPLAQIGTVPSLAIITVLMLRRFVRGQREREQLKLELEQARQVQQMLIPATVPNTPGFAVETVYLPASSVGGDFFQVLPGEDGSLLIVVGDVSGKGLKAAMTVSTIVGALRNEPSRQPSEILVHLNRVLHGQINGFVTCAAALIAADGAMTLANAGHLSPYRNGQEMAVESGLPLGILGDGSYAETHYQLATNDRLTFVSDGVVEATNEKRELFGFERTQAISNQPAHEIAEAAKQFGQEDDISVLSVTRTVNMKAALA